jgi:hypothetical protein
MDQAVYQAFADMHLEVLKTASTRVDYRAD